MDIAIIGYGNVGKEIERKIRLKELDDRVYTIDINPKMNAEFLDIDEFNRREYAAEVYIICVWSQEQVLDVIKKIRLDNKPLISIETTCPPGTYAMAKDIVKDNTYLIVFPERRVVNDDFHSVFNHPRIMGGDYEQGRRFYLRYMLWENIIITDKPELAELCKIVENSYRYLTIAVAEELKMLFGDDFDELRRLINTKWNTEILEVRDGVKGICLPKDIKLFNDYFKKNRMFKLAEKINEEYIDGYNKNIHD